MNRLTRLVATLLFGSGMCALIYQIAWFREFRLVFGASTAANAAVLAVFIGGLGTGSLVLGKRADTARRPLALYAKLEAAAAIFAALTPGLLWITRQAYIASGGSTTLGSFGATVLRLVLTVVVLVGPTFLMGGTLPAAARAVESDDDASRRRLGLLYGMNALGAVAGCVIANFFLLEALGTRMTLWSAAAANLVIALIARALTPAAEVAPSATVETAPAVTGRPRDAKTTESDQPATTSSVAALTSSPSTAGDATIPRWFVLSASAGVGFVFFLLELVWYRLLGPLLGGTVFTFGIILAVALAGIGIGGAAYALFGSRRSPTLQAFAITCLLEGIFVALPYALGDRIATLALLLRPLGSMRFAGLAAGWTIVTVVVVLPAAIVAGAQFPMLIALLGRGRSDVGEQTGAAYAANTAGSIAGALAGGFGLMPVLTVIGSFRFSAWMLAAIGLAAGFLLLRQRASLQGPTIAIIGAILIGTLIEGEGPTAVWRHSAIGVGRVPADATSSVNAYRLWMNSERRAMKWEADGVESTVALDGRHGWAFLVNGKSDGHIELDAPTQVMGGLLGAVLRPVKTAMVIGLGTGSTAGWLGALPEIERVDVAELEPAILHVAEVSKSANRDVLKNPKVHISIGDAREILLTRRDRYDLVFSEPSNPYRAGVASLFTREYYEACASRLAEDGLFLQWVQAYDVDKRTVRAVYATLASVFPEIETWELAVNDFLLVASKKKIHHDLTAIRAKIAEEPLRSALAATWRVVDAEGFFGHYVANADFSRRIAAANTALVGTDDKNLIEFGFARSTSGAPGSEGEEVRSVARASGQHRPPELEKTLDWELADDAWQTFRAASNAPVVGMDQMKDGARHRGAALMEFAAGNPRAVLAHWAAQPREARDPTELALVAQSMAEFGDDNAIYYIDKLRPLASTEAAAILGRLRLRQNRLEEAAGALDSAFQAYRAEPWGWIYVMALSFETAKELVQKNGSFLGLFKEAFSQPFAGAMFDDKRREILLSLALAQKMDKGCVEILRPYEPYPPWQEEMLAYRVRCYALAKDPLRERATRELDLFNANKPMAFGKGLEFVHASP